LPVANPRGRINQIRAAPSAKTAMVVATLPITGSNPAFDPWSVAPQNGHTREPSGTLAPHSGHSCSARAPGASWPHTGQMCSSRENRAPHCVHLLLLCMCNRSGRSRRPGQIELGGHFSHRRYHVSDMPRALDPQFLHTKFDISAVHAPRKSSVLPLFCDGAWLQI